MSAWREALRQIRVSWVAAVWLGSLVLALLSTLWLQIPDSHAWQFVFSLLSACGLVALFFWFCCWAFQRISKPEDRNSWWLSWLLLVAVIAIWWLLQIPVDKLA